MGSHNVTCHPTQVSTPRLNPSHTGRYSIYLPQRDGRLSWPRWLIKLLHTEMVYPPAGGHPSKYQPGPVSTNYIDRSQPANQYTTPPQCCVGAGRRFVSTHQVAALCCMKWRHGHHLTSNRKSRLCQSMLIYLNIPAKFHPDPIWNYRALGVFKDGRPSNNKKQQGSAIWDQFLIKKSTAFNSSQLQLQELWGK